MDKEHAKSAADKASGAVKETVGKLTGDKKLETEGKMEQAKGQAREYVGDAKEAAKKMADRN